MKYQSFTGKTVDDAINKAIIELGVTSSQLDFIVIDKGAAGILGILMECEHAGRAGTPAAEDFEL